MDRMGKVRRSAVALVAAGAAVLGGTAGAQASESRADEAFSFTAEKYSAIPFGMSKAEAWEFLDGAHSRPGSADGWCEQDTNSILCFTESNDYAPYGGFSFNGDGKLYLKRHELLFTPKTPSMTLSEYNKVQVGMGEEQLWSVVSKDSCVLQSEAFSNWPATNGRTLKYYCSARTGLFPPNARFYLTDGKVNEKYQYNLT